MSPSRVSSGASIVAAGLAALSLHAASQATEAQPAPSAAAAQIVVKDAESGDLRAATPDETKALTAPAKGALRVAPARTMPKVHESGAQGARLTDAFMSYSVAVRQADGKLATQCVDSKAEAEAAVKTQTVVKTNTLATE